MYYLLFTFYLAIVCLVINRNRFIKSTGLTDAAIMGLFLLKIAAGILIGWMFGRYYPQGNDLWDLNDYGIKEYQVLVNDPTTFFTDIFYYNYTNDQTGFFSSTASYWNDLENNIIIKFLGFCNIFSRGNYYINSIFFNFFGFFGHVALYKIFIHIYADKKLFVIAGCFLLPSALFFSSGISKDNIIFTLLCIFCYAVFFSLKNGFTKKRICITIVCYTGILLIRNYVAIVMIPGLIAWWLCSKYSFGKLKTFSVTYFITAALLVMLPFLNPSLNAAKVIAQKQQDFFALGKANTQIETDTISATVPGLLKNAPQAVNHGFLRPYIWEHNAVFSIAQALEIIGYLLLLILYVFLQKRKNTVVNNFLPFIMITSVIILLLNGYIVPNFNTLVRYRSIYLPFLVTPLLCQFSLSIKK